MEEIKRRKKKPTARIYQMRMETAITSSPDSVYIPHNLWVFCFPFCFGQNQTPIAQCTVCYLMGERGEATNSSAWARCSLSGNQLGLGSVPQALWVEKAMSITSIKCPICSFPLAASLKTSVPVEQILKECATVPILIFTERNPGCVPCTGFFCPNVAGFG